MVRPKRIAKGNLVYHVLNRANGRLRIFKKRQDFQAFENVLAEGIERFEMRLCGYCIMGNHWHLVLWPRQDGDLSDFMKWVTATHSHRWHRAHDTVSCGHLYQGRYKSFPVQSNEYYLTLMRYVESNPLRAGLVQDAAEWPWSSFALRMGLEKELALDKGPLDLPTQWFDMVNRPGVIAARLQEHLSQSLDRGRPFGDAAWLQKTARLLGLESTLRPKGRPKGTTKGV